GSDTAVLIAYVDGLNFTGSTLSENLEGLRLVASSNASISANRFIRNQISFVPLVSQRILFDHNDVIHSALQAYIGSGNDVRWDAGYPGGGNYWSDRTTPDRCGGPDQTVCPQPDGIADVPDLFAVGGQDRYPLIRPFTGPALPPTAGVVMTPAFPSLDIPITFDGSGSYDEDGVILSGDWTFGDGAVASGMVVTHAYSW